MSTEDEIEIRAEALAKLPWSPHPQIRKAFQDAVDAVVSVAARRAERDRAEIERLHAESLEAQETIQELRDAAQQSHESIVVRQEEIDRLRGELADLRAEAKGDPSPGDRVRVTVGDLDTVAAGFEGRLVRIDESDLDEGLPYLVARDDGLSYWVRGIEASRPAESEPAVPAHSEKAEPWRVGDQAMWVDSDSKRQEGVIESFAVYELGEPELAFVVDDKTGLEHEVYVYNLDRPVLPAPGETGEEAGE